MSESKPSNWMLNIFVALFLFLIAASFFVPAYVYLKLQKANQSVKTPDEAFLLREMGINDIKEHQRTTVRRNGQWIHPLSGGNSPKRFASETAKKYQDRWQGVRILPLGGILLSLALVALIRSRRNYKNHKELGHETLDANRE